jgi:hypothetical protein
MNATLDLSHQRALEDLFSAERQLREQNERFIQEFRQVLLETAIRLDGERLEAIRRENPQAPTFWTVAEWRTFMREIPSVRGWGISPVPLNTPSQREHEMILQVESLKMQLESVLHELDEEKARTSERIVDVDDGLSRAGAEKIDLPEGAKPRLADIIVEAQNILSSLPHKPSTAFAKVLDGGNRVGGDLKKAYQRYGIALYLVGHWGVAASMEIEEALATVVGVESGSGSLKRLLEEMSTANVFFKETLSLNTPRTALKLYRLSESGEKLYQTLFSEKPVENEWSKLIRLHEGERFPEHTLGVLTFAMHARKRGYATYILPQVQGNAEPDVWIGRSDEQLYVEVELGMKERTAKWRNQVGLNDGKVAICAGTEKGRQRLAGDCKLDNLSGVATDLEALIATKYKTVDHTTLMWIEQW